MKYGNELLTLGIRPALMLIFKHHLLPVITDEWKRGLTLVLQVRHNHTWSPPLVITSKFRQRTLHHSFAFSLCVCTGKTMNMCLFYCSNSQVQFFFFLYHSAPLLRQRKNCLFQNIWEELFRGWLLLLYIYSFPWKMRVPWGRCGRRHLGETSHYDWIQKKTKVIIIHLVNFNALTATAKWKMAAVDLPKHC